MSREWTSVPSVTHLDSVRLQVVSVNVKYQKHLNCLQVFTSWPPRRARQRLQSGRPLEPQASSFSPKIGRLLALSFKQHGEDDDAV